MRTLARFTVSSVLSHSPKKSTIRKKRTVANELAVSTAASRAGEDKSPKGIAPQLGHPCPSCIQMVYADPVFAMGNGGI